MSQHTPTQPLPNSKGQLAAAYGISLPTLHEWMQGVCRMYPNEFTNYNNIRLFTPKQMELIFNHLGKPNGYE